MRTAKRTRRTFPKTLKNKDGFALENEVSSVEDRNGAFKPSSTNDSVTFSSFQSTPAPQAEGSASQPEAAPAPTPRRKSDSNMDMFRNMAKNIRK